MESEVKVKEIFESIQGEGLYVGAKQLFVRFCKCNLSCKYCDTDFSQRGSNSYSPSELVKYLDENFNLKTLHSISLTGGEPLCVAEFLKEFLPLIFGKIKVYLETNATLYNEFSEIKNYVDIISADIKLPSCCGINLFDVHEKFFKACVGKNVFAKIVFDYNITDDEIETCCNLCKKFSVPLILQPKMVNDELSVDAKFCGNVMDKFLMFYENVRLIPQVHKFLGVE